MVRWDRPKLGIWFMLGRPLAAWRCSHAIAEARPICRAPGRITPAA